MSVIERAQRARYYQVGGFPLSSLNIFNLEQAKRTHSLQYLEQVTNLCEKIKLSPEQYNKQHTSNKLKLLKAFQYSILYSRNLKAIYDQKESQLMQKNTQLQQQIREKKQSIKLHKQKVDKRKAQYRQMKVDHTKSAYQTFSNEISNLKIKQEELNVIKLQLQSQIDIAKQQLNSPYHPQMFQPIPPPSPHTQNYPYYPDPSSFHHPYNMNNYNSFPKLSTHSQPNNDFNLTTSQLNNPNQGQKLFYQQNIQQQRESKLKTQQSNFTLNGSWTVLDEENRIDEMNSKNSKQQNNILSYQNKVSQQKKDSKGMMMSSKIKKLRIDMSKISQDQPQQLSSPTSTFIIPNTQEKIKPQQQDSSSFDDLNSHLLGKPSVVNRKSNVQGKKSIISSIKEQSRQTSKIHDNDSLLLRRLKQESNISKKSSQSSVEYKFQDQIKQTPNLNYYLESNTHISNELSYSKIGDIEGDIWASTKGSTETDINMKMFNFQPKRKQQDQQNARNTIQSYKQSSIEVSESKQIKHTDLDVSSFDKLDDDLDDLDLGMDTRNSIIEIKVDKKSKAQNVVDTRKTENIKKQFGVSINTLEQVPQQSESDFMKRDSIPIPPALNKNGDNDYGDQQYQQDYEQEFQDELQVSKPKGKVQSNIKDKDHRQRNDYKSEVEINVPSNTSFIEVNNNISKHEPIFKDITDETFSPNDPKFKNNTNGIFSDLQIMIDLQSKQQTQQSNIKSVSTNKNEESQFEDSFDLPQATTIGKKPKVSTRSPKSQPSDLDESDKLLILQQPLESKVISQKENSSTLKNQQQSIGKKYLENHELTVSIPLQNSTQIHQQKSIVQQNQDQISQQIEYQFEDSSKFNQSQKQQIQRKIVSLLRNKNKVKNNNQLSQKMKSKQQQIKIQIDKEINQNIINQSNLKGKQQDWKQVAKIFQNKINELIKQSGSSSQINKKLSEIQQKSSNTNNKKTNIGSKENSATSSKHLNQNASESDENVELNYSQSILKDQLKPQLKKKNKLDLSDVPSANENLTNSSNLKNESFSFDDSLGYSLGLKSNFGLKKKEEEKVSQTQNMRQNKLMGVQKQQQKAQQVSRSKYVKLSNSKTNSSIPKQSAFTKIQQNKYVSIEDPLNNQIAQKKPIIKQKVPDDDDDF